MQKDMGHEIERELITYSSIARPIKEFTLLYADQKYKPQKFRVPFEEVRLVVCMLSRTEMLFDYLSECRFIFGDQTPVSRPPGFH